MKQSQNIVYGRRVTSPDSFESRNPSTGEVLGHVPFSTAVQVTQAVAAAKSAQPGWAARPDAERQAAVMKVVEVLQANAEHLATWIAKEQGKPLGGVGPDQVPGARFEAWACGVWSQVSACLVLEHHLDRQFESRRHL